jgi:hypothetical protein
MGLKLHDTESWFYFKAVASLWLMQRDC